MLVKYNIFCSGLSPCAENSRRVLMTFSCDLCEAGRKHQRVKKKGNVHIYGDEKLLPTTRKKKSQTPRKMANWRDDEIRELLSIRSDAEIGRQIHGTVRDSVVYDQITKRLRGRGVIRSKAQVTSKLKGLKRQYNQIAYQNGQSENDRKPWCYFSLCNSIWGSSHTTNPVALTSSTETASASESLETVSINMPICTSSPPETPCRPTSSVPETLCVPKSILSDTPVYSDTEDKKPDVSRINDMFVTTTVKKKRYQTRSESLTAEVRDLFSEMDKDFNEQERLRLLEQREYEERLRSEAQADKAREMALIQDMTSALRQMVQNIPGTQPQCSLSAAHIWSQDQKQKRDLNQYQYDLLELEKNKHIIKIENVQLQREVLILQKEVLQLQKDTLMAGLQPVQNINLV